jgi:tetratricopeptide (TPR) repeat protein
VSPRLKVIGATALAGAVTVAAVVGVTLATRTDVPKHRPPGPPFAADPTAPPGLQRAVREALDAWPAGTARHLRLLAAQNPRSALVRFELGLALALAGQTGQAQQAWRAARRVQPDSPSAVRAEDALHPEAPPGKPPFIASFTRPRTAVERLLARGIAFQDALRPVSAERAFAAAARAAPDDAEAQVAAAVGLYDKDRPAVAFSRLGPLARRFPQAQTVRFHLGLLLIYLRQFDQARRELRLAVADGPQTPLAKRARTLLNATRKA